MGTRSNGKIVLDATNPIAAAPPVNGVLSFFTGPNDSLLERLQKKAPKARFVKAFSCVGNAAMVNPKLPAKPSMFICGNDSAAKEQARAILDRFGWETEDMGERRSGARHRAALHALVHPRDAAERLGRARVQDGARIAIRIAPP